MTWWVFNLYWWEYKRAACRKYLVKVNMVWFIRIWGIWYLQHRRDYFWLIFCCLHHIICWIASCWKDNYMEEGKVFSFILFPFTETQSLSACWNIEVTHCSSQLCPGSIQITLASSSPEVNTYMSDRIKVAEYHEMYINFWKLVKAKKKIKWKISIILLSCVPLGGAAATCKEGQGGPRTVPP